VPNLRVDRGVIAALTFYYIFLLSMSMSVARLRCRKQLKTSVLISSCQFKIASVIPVLELLDFHDLDGLRFLVNFLTF